MQRFKTVILVSFFSSQVLMGDILGLPINGYVECDSFSGLGRLLKPTDFSFNIGGCTISSSGLEKSPAITQYLDTVSEFENLMGNFSYSTKESDITDDVENGDERIEKAIDEKVHSIFSRDIAFLDPSSSDEKDDEVFFMGGETSSETQKIIAEETVGLSFPSSDGESQNYASIDSATPKEDCSVKKTSEEAIACDLKESLSLNQERVKVNEEGLEKEAKKKKSFFDLATLGEKVLNVVSHKIAQYIPPGVRGKYVEASSKKMAQDTVFRADEEAIKKLRENMSEIISHRNAISSSSIYPDLASVEVSSMPISDIP